MNQFIKILAFISIFSLTACSGYKKPLPDSGVTAKEVASESYDTFKNSLQELKSAFFPE